MENSKSKKVLFYYTAALIICFVDILIYLSVKSIWFFIDKMVNNVFGSNIPWSWLIFTLFSIVIIYLFINFILNLTRQKHYFKSPRLINLILPGVFVLVLTSADAVLYSMLGSSSGIVARNLVGMMPLLLLMSGIIFFIIIYPKLHISKSNVFKVSFSFMAVLLIMIYFNGYGRVKITSGPIVQYIDDSNIAVMWTTNKNSTGYIEYGPDKSNLKKVEPIENGIVAANTKIHKVIIPVKSTSRFVYRVVSTKIKNYYQNKIEFGNTTASDFKTFAVDRDKDSVTFYVLNDIHENSKIYSRFLLNSDYDFVVLGGDTVNSVDSEKIIIDDILKPLGIYTNGEKPIYFVRGNHETRGAAQGKIIDYISLPGKSFYYDFKFGPVFALVLDSGEDKLDSHEEYSGLAHFSEYRSEETDWLLGLSGKVKEDSSGLYKIAFVHIPLNSYIDSPDSSYLKEYEEKWISILNGMNMDAVFSGHTHSPEIIDSGNDKMDFPIFIGGGEYNNLNGYAAIKVNAAKDSMKIQYISYAGSITNEYEIKRKAPTPEQ